MESMGVGRECSELWGLIMETKSCRDRKLYSKYLPRRLKWEEYYCRFNPLSPSDDLNHKFVGTKLDA